MGTIRTLHPLARKDTFDDVGDLFTKEIAKCYTMADTVVEVFDRYDHKDSIKAAEHNI